MYQIIGADGSEYGPVSAEGLRHWIAEGRLNAQSQARPEGTTEWKPLGTFPEFADALAARAPGAAPAPFSPGPSPPPTPADFLGRDYDLDIVGCISRGWEMFKENVGPLLGAFLIYAGIELVIAVLGAIPCIGPLFSMANLVVVGPLVGGLYYVFLRAVRRQATSAGDIFTGFRTSFGQLFLGQLVTGLLTGLCLLPAAVAGFLVMLPSIIHDRAPGPAQIAVVVAIVLICMVPMIFVSLNFMFALPLIIDQRMQFWPAMVASWKMVTKHWWRLFGLAILGGLLNLLGVVCCLVGVLVTGPVFIGALMVAYETIFRPPVAAAAPA